MKLNVQKYIEDRFKNAKVSGNEINFSCPFCDDSARKMGFNLEKQLGHCFKAKCGWRGSILNFVCDYENVDYAEAYQLLKGHKKETIVASFNKAVSTLKKQSKIQTFAEGVTLPKYTEKVTKNSKSLEGRKAYKYLKRRISYEMIRFFNLYFSYSNKFAGRIIIPYYENKKLVYYVGRDYWNRENAEKYLFPSKSDVVKGNSNYLYNIDNAARFAHVYVLEGPFDVYSIGLNSTSIGGSDLSDVQLSKILKCSFEKISILLDPDVPEKIQKIAEKLYNYSDVEICSMEGGDPGELGLSGVSSRSNATLSSVIKSKISSQKFS